MKNIYKVLLAAGLLAIGAIATVKMFGTTVDEKFNNANEKVTSQVMFGGEDDYKASASPEPAPERAKRQIVITAGDRMDSPAEPKAEEAVALDPTPTGDNFKDYGVNRSIKTSDDPLSTFSIDVDTASYAIARGYLERNDMPDAAGIRVEEFLNYFRYNYADPEGGVFAVDFEAMPSPFRADPNWYVMRVGVQGKRIKAEDRKPVHLTFLIDVSGSMRSDDKIGLAKHAMKTVTENLGPKDTIAITTYAARTELVLEPTGASKKKKILKAIDALKTGGGTAMSDGMLMAYKQAAAAHKDGDVSRVIVMSDGDANIGSTNYEFMLNKIKAYVDDGITMSTIGFGNGNYNDENMEQLANRGNGNYYYIDNAMEAKRVFEDQLAGTLEVIAKDVKIQVEFDPAKIVEYRLIGYENRAIADRDFRNDHVDAGEIGAGHAVTALYEVRVKGGLDGDLATVRIRAKKPEGSKADEAAFAFTDADIRKNITTASRDFAFQIAVAQFAEKLRRSPFADGIKYSAIEEIATGATTDEPDRKEFLSLLKKVQNNAF